MILVLKALQEISREVVAEIGSGNETAKKIYSSYQQFRTLITDWSDILRAGRAEQSGYVRIMSSAPTGTQTTLLRLLTAGFGTPLPKANAAECPQLVKEADMRALTGGSGYEPSEDMSGSGFPQCKLTISSRFPGRHFLL